MYLAPRVLGSLVLLTLLVLEPQCLAHPCQCWEWRGTVPRSLAAEAVSPPQSSHLNFLPLSLCAKWHEVFQL